MNSSDNNATAGVSTNNNASAGVSTNKKASAGVSTNKKASAGVSTNKKASAGVSTRKRSKKTTPLVGDNYDHTPSILGRLIKWDSPYLTSTVPDAKRYAKQQKDARDLILRKVSHILVNGDAIMKRFDSRIVVANTFEIEDSDEEGTEDTAGSEILTADLSSDPEQSEWSGSELDTDEEDEEEEEADPYSVPTEDWVFDPDATVLEVPAPAPKPRFPSKKSPRAEYRVALAHKITHLPTNPDAPIGINPSCPKDGLAYNCTACGQLPVKEIGCACGMHNRVCAYCDGDCECYGEGCGTTGYPTDLCCCYEHRGPGDPDYVPDGEDDNQSVSSVKASDRKRPLGSPTEVAPSKVAKTDDSLSVLSTGTACSMATIVPPPPPQEEEAQVALGDILLNPRGEICWNTQVNTSSNQAWDYNCGCTSCAKYNFPQNK